MLVPPLVGRELELAAAVELLQRVEDGAPAALLVRGEAGIGKSRLVGELVALARDRGAGVLGGRADDLDAGIPYAVFRDLLARMAVEGGGPAVAVDDLRRVLDGAPAGRGDGDRLAAVFATAVQTFRDVAAGGPTLLVLEDLHLADGDSLALAAPLVRLADVPMLTVVTARPGPQPSDIERLLERMAVDGRGTVLDLGPLDRRDTGALVAAVLDAQPDEALIDAVVAACAGNPFFAREAARSFADGGAVAIAGGRASLRPDAPGASLRPSTGLLGRLFGGRAGDVELAKVLAVLGRFQLRQLDLVERVTGRSEDEVAAAFDRLVRAGLVQPAAGGYEFTHSIVRTTLVEDIGPAERRRIHAAVAAELAGQRRAGIVLDVVELATHVAESAEPGDEAAAEVLLDAGRVVAATAPLVSAGYHRRAAALLPEGSPRRSDALSLPARALHLGNRPAEAAEVGRSALASLPPGPARSATVAVVVNDLYLGGDVADARAVVADELAAGADACPLVALEVNLAFQAGDPATADRRFDDALAALDGPPAAELMALTHLVQYANHTRRMEVAAALLDRVSDLTTSGSSAVRVGAHELAAFADWRPGVLPRIDDHLAAVRALRPDAGVPSLGGSIEAVEAWGHFLAGRWDAAAELVRVAGFDLEQRGVLTSAQLLRCLAVRLAVERGALGEAGAEEARLVQPIVALVRDAAFVRARLRRALDDRAGAEALLQDERRAAVAGGSAWLLAEVLEELVELLHGAGRLDEAAAVALEAEAVAARTGWPEATVPARRARALLDGDVDAAREAGAVADAEGWVVEAARAALLRGELGDDPGTTLPLAYRAFDAVGATPRRRRAAAALRARGLSVPRRAVRAASSLTETELQLARLVHDGLSNRQIAAALHYSPKTIEVYLSRLYGKTGCTSRLELIRAIDAGGVELTEVELSSER